MNYKILVSIVNWNSTSATNKCLAGIAGIPKSEQPDLIVTDNNSTFDKLTVDPLTVKGLRSLEIIRNTKNLGFAGGHNPNIERAKLESYDYIFLLNPDTELIDSSLFKKLINSLESNPEALAAAPTIVKQSNPDVIWFGGGQLSLITSRVGHLRVGKSTINLPDKPQQVSFLTGCCVAINLKRASLEQLLLPEEYFVYWEDTEWCARALKSGFRLLWVPDALLLHHVSDSLGVRSPSYIYYNIRNHFLFIERNVPPAYWPLCFLRVSLITVRYKLNILIRYDKDKRGAFKALWYGWIDGLIRRKGKLRRSL